MANYRAQCEWRNVSGLQADSAVNTLYCTADDDTAAGLFAATIGSAFTTFSVFMSNAILLGAAGLRIKLYDMADPEPREPIQTTTYTMTPSGSVLPMPLEVAIVLSYRSAYESGVAAASKRGRIYLPWLAEDNNDTTARPNSALVAGVLAIGTTIRAASVAASTWDWAQHSAKLDSYDTVIAGFVDNEWDTQRRRGRLATTRSTFS
jgi:hypothetical protein